MRSYGEPDASFKVQQLSRSLVITCIIIGLVAETISTHARAQQLLSRSPSAIAATSPAVHHPNLRNQLLTSDFTAVASRLNPRGSLNHLEAQMLLLQQLRASAAPRQPSIQEQLLRQQQAGIQDRLNQQQQGRIQEQLNRQQLNRQQHVAPALLQALSLQNQLLAQRQFVASSPTRSASQRVSLNAATAAALVAYQQQQQPHLQAPSVVDTITSQVLSTHMRMNQEDAAQGNNQQSVHAGPTAATNIPVGLTGRAPFPVARGNDEGRLTPYQCLARQHIQYFEAGQAQVEEGAQGRNKPIVLGQVGIRCIHCAGLARKDKAPAAAFYPAKLSGIYQSAQNIMNSHLAKDCQNVPPNVRERLKSTANRKSPPGTGKAYWSDEAMNVGIFEDEHGLRFLPLPASHIGEAAVASSGNARVL